MSPGRIGLTASHPTLPCPFSPPLRAPPRPDQPEVCPGFGFVRSEVQRRTCYRGSRCRCRVKYKTMSVGRRLKTLEAGALKTLVRMPRSSAARKVPVRKARGVQLREAANRGRSTREEAATARDLVLGGARCESTAHAFPKLRANIRSSAICLRSAC